MAMQWAGTFPEQGSQWGELAKALKGGLESGVKGYTAGHEMKLEVEKLAREEAATQREIDKETYDKKVELVKIVQEMSKDSKEDAYNELWNDPKMQTILTDLKWPTPTWPGEGTDLQSRAVAAIGRGETLPNMSDAQTAKAAKVYISPTIPTLTDIKEAKKARGWRERLTLGKQKQELVVDRMVAARKRAMNLGGSSADTDTEDAIRRALQGA